MKKTKKLALLAMVTAIALILSYVEAVLPPIFPAVPGIKMGLANIAIMFMLYRGSLTEAALVSGVRILLSALLFGSVLSLIYSVCGAALSIIIMYALKKSELFSTVGISIAGAVAHNVAQVICAIILMHTKEIGYYMIALTVSGVVSGIFVGILAGIILKRIDRGI